jgi:hypothetical protein
MTAELKGCALALLAAAAAAGCNNADTPPPVDAAPTVTFTHDFISHNWSISTINNETQLTISDTPGAAACALSADQHNTLTGMGGEIIVHVPGPTDGPCPTGNYTIKGTDGDCSRSPGTDAFVPEACGFFVTFDATGKPIGNTPALNGVIKFSGDENACTIEATVGFLGASFTDQADLATSPASGPWCVDN